MQSLQAQDATGDQAKEFFCAGGRVRRLVARRVEAKERLMPRCPAPSTFAFILAICRMPGI